MPYDAHTAFRRHMMKIDANFASVRIHAADTCVQRTPNVPSIFHKLIHHLPQFVVKVRNLFTENSLCILINLCEYSGQGRRLSSFEQ